MHYTHLSVSPLVVVISGMQQLCSAVRRHHPPQRVVLSQICCFGESKVVPCSVDYAVLKLSVLSVVITKEMNFKSKNNFHQDYESLYDVGELKCLIITQVCICICVQSLTIASLCIISNLKTNVPMLEVQISQYLCI